MKLSLRKSNKYYQIGYSEGGKWHMVEYVGTVETMLDHIRTSKEVKRNSLLPISKITKLVTNKFD